MKTNPIHLVIIEDNPDLRDDLHFQLSSDSIHVTSMEDGKNIDEHLLKEACDVAIIDIGLPGEDGLSIAERLHQTHPEIGLILLTAQASLDSRLDGLHRGADIYLVKPVSCHELRAQINSLYRRINPVSRIWQLKQAGRELISPQGVSIRLTGMEGSLMTILSQNQSQAVSRQRLVDAIAIGDINEFDPRRIEVCISRLRQKLHDSMVLNTDSDSDIDLPLKTVRNVGYVFTQPVTIS